MASPASDRLTSAASSASWSKYTRNPKKLVGLPEAAIVAKASGCHCRCYSPGRVARTQQSAWRFSVTVERTGDTAILRVVGRFGHQAAPEFEKAAQACLAAKVSGIVIDLAGADYLSSPGLRAIVALATRMEELKGQVIVRGARDAVRVTLGLADFTKTKKKDSRF